jgi:4-amino-4-deoxy-L-arabinose transferase-like glycosyltransferase
MSQLEDAVAQMLFKVTAAAETATEFVVGQLPDVAQQYIAWQIADGLLWCFFCLAVTFVVYRFTSEKDWKDLATLVWVVWFLLVVPIFLFNATQSLKAYVSPKIVLIEWAGNLAKKAAK